MSDRRMPQSTSFTRFLRVFASKAGALSLLLTPLAALPAPAAAQAPAESLLQPFE